MLQQVQQAVAGRLVDKRADELRTLLGATDDLSAEERAAALAEPAFIPEGDEPTPPALQPQPSLLSVTDDAKELALATVDVGTLTELKGVSRAWRALARRVLCSRLCSVDGQPVPKEKAEITNVNIELLFEAGRPWEAAAAGRQLPSLARLRWQGLVVDVAAVREVDLDEEDEEDEDEEDEEDEDEFGRPFLGGPAMESLLGCIEGRASRRLSCCSQPSPAPALARFAAFRWRTCATTRSLSSICIACRLALRVACSLPTSCRSWAR